MTQKNLLYDVVQHEQNSFILQMKENHFVYKGHFPGFPITPGVMTLQMVKECVNEIVSRELQYCTIKKCRFFALVKPGDKLKLDISTAEHDCIISVNALLTNSEDQTDVRLELESEMK